MDEIIENLKKAVIEYDGEAAASWARKAVEEGIDPIEALDALTVAIKQVGDGYGRGDLWLPDLVGASSAMISATPIIEEKIKATGGKRHKLGTIVIGTVYGDIHNIGKNMVSTLALAGGFEVIDLGVDVAAEKFVDAVRKHEPQILALSSLLTTSAYVQKEIIETLKKANLREKVKIAVGGGAITPEFAKIIGADEYRPTAIAAVDLFKEFVGVK